MSSCFILAKAAANAIYSGHRVCMINTLAAAPRDQTPMDFGGVFDYIKTETDINVALMSASVLSPESFPAADYVSSPALGCFIGIHISCDFLQSPVRIRFFCLRVFASPSALHIVISPEFINRYSLNLSIV